MEITIAIPCYNESGNIKKIQEELFPHIHTLGTAIEILFIDDGSNDTTVEEILKIKSPKVRLLIHARNSGLGAAIKTAIQEAKSNILIVLDADLTFHPQYIPLLVNEYIKTKAPCVIGSHLMSGGKVQSVQIHRLIMTKTLNFLYKVVFGQMLSSYSSMFRLYDLSVLRQFHLTRSGFDINAEILFRYIQKRYLISEVPVTLGVRTIGKSKLQAWTEIKNHIRLLYRVLVWRFNAKTE